MNRVTTIILLLTIQIISGCGQLTKREKAYAAGALTKQVIEDAHRDFWDPYVNRRASQCDPDSNEDVETLDEFEACLGPAAHNDQVLAALVAYGKAADALFVVLKTTEASPDDVHSAKERALEAAFKVLELMGPDALHYLDKLEKLIRRK